MAWIMLLISGKVKPTSENQNKSRCGRLARGAVCARHACAIGPSWVHLSPGRRRDGVDDAGREWRE